MPNITPQQLANYRARTFRTQPGLRLHTREDAVAFAQERGFLFFWPIKDVILPSLWAAAAGDRPVPDEHDDPGHVTWDWKDSLLGQRRWYYGRLLRRRNTIASLDALPHFYALSPNYGDYENDYQDQYLSGTLTLESKLIYEALLREGPLHTLDLRRAANLTASTSTGRFNKALDDLQVQLKVLPVGVAQAGAWHYAFIYDILPRHFPQIEAQAGPIQENEARAYLLDVYFRAVGAASAPQAARLLGWPIPLTLSLIQASAAAGRLLADVTLPDEPQPLFAHPEVLP